MPYFETRPIGLIIAALNVATFLLLVYLFLGVVAGERSALYRVLDRIFAPALRPLRRALPEWRIDGAALALAALLQLIVLMITRRYR